MIAEALVVQLKPGELPTTYKPVQAEIITALNRDYGLGLRPSDAFLLAHLKPEDVEHLSADQMEMIARFKRGDGYRFCLTRYFIEQDPEAQQLLAELRMQV